MIPRTFLQQALMLQWFCRTYPSYHLQPLLLKRKSWRGTCGALRQPAHVVQVQLPRLAGVPPASVKGLRLQLRCARAERRGVERAGRSCRAVTLEEMKTLRAHGFSQRPRFEQVVGWSGMPLTARPRSSPLLLGRLVQSSEGPNRSLCSTLPEGDSRESRR